MVIFNLVCVMLLCLKSIRLLSTNRFVRGLSAGSEELAEKRAMYCEMYEENLNAGIAECLNRMK